MKNIILLVIGIAAGYAIGFKDAKQHNDNIVVRIVGQVGGGNREKVKSTVDEQMKEAEKP